MFDIYFNWINGLIFFPSSDVALYGGEIERWPIFISWFLMKRFSFLFSLLDVKYILLTSFSLYSNGKRILSTERSGDTIGCLDGLRYLSMCWIIYGHTFYLEAVGVKIDRSSIPKVCLKILIPTNYTWKTHPNTQKYKLMFYVKIRIFVLNEVLIKTLGALWIPMKINKSRWK